MSPWRILFFAISITIASAQSLRQNEYNFSKFHILATQRQGDTHSLRVVVDDGRQKAIKYVFLKSIEPRVGRSSTELPGLPSGDWNEAYFHFNTHTGLHELRDLITTTHLGMMDSWYPRELDYLEFVIIETIQHDRLQVAVHPDFDSPVLIKIASFPWEIPYLEREAEMYRLLHGSGATPGFLGHVTESNRVIGFITEYIDESVPAESRDRQGCLGALRRLHQRGIAHGDAHDGNCMIRKNGSAVLIDFELSEKTLSTEEFERDLEIMGRCIQVISDNA